MGSHVTFLLITLFKSILLWELFGSETYNTFIVTTFKRWFHTLSEMKHNIDLCFFFYFQLNLRWTDEVSGSLTKRLTTQAGPWRVWRTGALTSTWASPAWSCCAWSGGCTRLVVSWQVCAIGLELWPHNCWDKFANWWLSLPPPSHPTYRSDQWGGTWSSIDYIPGVKYCVYGNYHTVFVCLFFCC